jgi:nicotinamidase-related amidase
MTPGPQTPLVLIDLQKAVDHPRWGVRNNPEAEHNAARLLSVWRARDWPIIHIRHDSRRENSTYAPGQPYHEWKPETAPLPGETVLAKYTCSAFLSTSLEENLRAAGAGTVFFCGVTTNNSVEATVRNAGDLGFDTWLVTDACFTFGKRAWSADEVHAMSLANLEGEYCLLTSTEEILAAAAL